MRIVSSAFAFCISFVASGAQSEQAPRRVEFAASEIDLTGAEDVSPTLLDAIADGGVHLILPCGTYLIGAVVDLPSRTSVQGQGRCTILKIAKDAKPTRIQGRYMANSSGKQRSIFTNREPGDSGIEVRNLSIDGRDVPTHGQMISFYRASNITIDNVSFIGSGTIASQDGVSFVSSSDFVVKNSECKNFTNACYDIWGGSRSFKIFDNAVDGGGVLTYGILVNGLTTDNQAADSSGGTIYRNKIANIKDLGIGAYGLCSPDRKTCGTVSNLSIEENQIDGVSRYHGIWVGNGSGIVISKNVIRNVVGDGVRVSAQNQGGQTTNVVVEKNQITGSAAASTGVSVGTGSDRPTNIRIQQDNIIVGYARKTRIAPLPQSPQ